MKTKVACILFLSVFAAFVSNGCILFMSFDCDDDKNAEHDEDSPCWCKSGEALKECRELHGLGGSDAGGGGAGGDGVGGTTNVTTTNTGGTGGGDPCPGQKLCGDACVALDDPSTGCASASCDPCPFTGAACASGVCAGPCGPVPDDNLWVCVVYGLSVPGANDHVGLAGGIADPGQGQTIQNQFLDPMGGCTNPVGGEPFVWCNLGSPPANADIQFRAGLHAAVGTGTTAGTWDCSDTSCASSVYAYHGKNEIGSLIANVPAGAVSTTPHFNPPYLLNVIVTPP